MKPDFGALPNFGSELSDAFGPTSGKSSKGTGAVSATA